jgi:hypothetical protein
MNKLWYAHEMNSSVKEHICFTSQNNIDWEGNPT